MFQDEARFGRINDVRRCWAPKPIRPLCQAMLTHEYTYAYASCEPATGTMDALILPQVNTQCMQIFLDTVAARHVNDHIVMVMDGAGWHSSKKLVAPSNIRLLALPPYAPELNPVELVWAYLKRHLLANYCPGTLEQLKAYLRTAWPKIRYRQLPAKLLGIQLDSTPT